MSKPIFAAVCVLLCQPALADYLEVRRNANIKTEPTSSASTIMSVEPPETLVLVTREQTNGYYNVHVPGSMRTGWIYRTLGRGFPGDPPERTDEALQALKERHLAVGTPEPYFVRIREGYAVGYDARLKIPLWVQYKLSPEDFTGSAGRSDDFRPDITLPVYARAANSDYDESRNDSEKFARGHMASAADMARGERVMSDSFYLSNMVPQVGDSFNGTVWMDLERDIRNWTKNHGAVTVITGPVFATKEIDGTRRVTYRVIGENEVAVPTHLYKIVLDNLTPRMLAFVLENREYEGTETYREHQVSVDAVEALVDLDFFGELDDEVEAALEVRETNEIWFDDE